MKHNVGDGWTDLIAKFYNYISIIDNGSLYKTEIVSIENDRGMLKIVTNHPNPVYQDMLDKLAWAIQRESARVCEVCGEPGYRRKIIKGSPNRCQPHYLELIQTLKEKEMLSQKVCTMNQAKYLFCLKG